ncbi:MAG: serine/threonine-protein kinase [Gemmataceae bacterium]
MPEPQFEKNVPPVEGQAGSPASPPSSSTDGNPNGDLLAEALLDSPDVLNDEAPTIISRSPPRADRPPEEAFTTTLRGRELAHFALIEPIGVGGMAAVIRASDKQLERTVALKILPPEMATDPENIRRFQQEARAAAKLDHENIARVFYCGEDQGLNFIAFEFVEGENLRTVLERRGRIPIREAIQYMIQIAAGLAHANERGVVHRDIKPSNIIVTPTGRAKLVDMGLARSLEPRHEGALTQSGVTLGTFDYISPEQALEPREADVRSDIYSLGCTLYHMLTGQPPVPEGTAAKKLHCHQHVNPTDPRLLNAEIPDEVAAILARMMAKNPKDRYQRPEQLVQHLLHVAQKMGIATDMPDGVLFVDAPIPSPPRARPVLIGGAATAALVAFIVLLGSLGESSSPSSEPSKPPFVQATNKPIFADKTEDNTKKQESSSHPEPTPALPPHETAADDRWEVVRSTLQLAEMLKQDKARIHLANHLEFTQRGPIFQGSELIIEPENPAFRPTIRLSYKDARVHPGPQPWAALALQGGKVTLRGLRFEVSELETGQLDIAALIVQGNAEVTIENCEFVQSGWGRSAQEPGRMSAILVPDSASDGSSRGKLNLYRCFFRGGQDAIRVNGLARVAAINCAWGPHQALFHLRGPKPILDSTIFLSSSSTLLEPNSKVFLLAEGASAKLTVGNCIFSQLKRHSAAEEGAVFIQQQGETLGTVEYESTKDQRNCFHNLAALWVRPPYLPDRELLEFRQAPTVRDRSSSIELPASVMPWASDDPLAQLDTDPRAAFQVNVLYSDLRHVDDSRRAIGVESATWGSTYPTPLEPPLGPAVRSPRIVDPSVTQIEKGVYPSLNLAVGDAQAGDVILIKHNAELVVDTTIRLERSDLAELTIKPYPKYQPVLTLRKATETDAALFRVHDGHLRLENLYFVIHPPSGSSFTSQSLIGLVGAGRVTFQNCVATLEGNPGIPARLVSLIEPAGLMRMGPLPPRTDPEVRLDQCLIRGKGDVLAVQPSRRFDLTVNDSLIAIDGSFLTIHGGNFKEDPLANSTVPSQVRLNHLTTYLRHHLIWLRTGKEEGKNGRLVVPTQVFATHCLFSSGSGNDLVHVDGLDSDEQMRRCLLWEGRNNLYSGFSWILAQQPMGDQTMLQPYDFSRWTSRLAVESDSKQADPKLKFKTPAAADFPLSRVLPSFFQVIPSDPDIPEDHSLYGADLNKIPAPKNLTGG